MKRAARTVALLSLIAGSASCGSSPKPQVKQCALNSDCASPLVCGQGYCVGQCVTGRDCPGDQDCIILPSQGKVCQAPAKKHCAYNSDCDPLFCGVDLQCRNQCQTDDDCPKGDKCAIDRAGTMLCVDPVNDAQDYDPTTNQIKAAPDAGVSTGGQTGGGTAGGGAGGKGGAAGGAGATAGAAAGGAGAKGGAGGGQSVAGGSGNPDGGLPPSCYKPANSTLHFGGAQYVTVPDSPSLHPSDLTIEAWVNFQTAPVLNTGPETILSKPNGAAAGDSFLIGYRTGMLFAGVAIADANTGTLTATWAPTLDRWYFVAFTYDHTTGKQKLYVDGELLASGDGPGPLSYDAHPLYVGADADNGTATANFGGDIDEVAIWSAARSGVQIQADLPTCLPAAVNDRVAYWTFDDGMGQTVVDSGPNGNSGFLGSATTADAADPTWIFSTNGYGGTVVLPTAGVSPTSVCGKPLNRALRTGVLQYAQATDAPSLRPQDFTFETWVTFDTTILSPFPGCSDTFTLATKGAGVGSASFALYYYLQNPVCGAKFELHADTTSGGVTYPWQPVFGRWYHLAVSFDHAAASNLKLYVDGNLVASGSVGAGPTYDGGPLRIGSSKSAPTPLDQVSVPGLIDEVKLWNTPRTLDQIAADMTSCTLSSLDGLAAAWSLDEGSGQVAYDATANRNNLQLGSAVTSDSADPAWEVSTVPFSASP